MIGLLGLQTDPVLHGDYCICPKISSNALFDSPDRHRHKPDAILTNLLDAQLAVAHLPVDGILGKGTLSWEAQ